MHPAQFTTQTTSDGVAERDFTVGEVPGVLWSPVSGPGHAPPVLMGHGGGLRTEAPIGYGGGISMGTAIGVPLTAAEPGSPRPSSAAGSSCSRR
jgi:hypothetical protein